jgi:hypothetical protein
MQTAFWCLPATDTINLLITTLARRLGNPEKAFLPGKDAVVAI